MEHSPIPLTVIAGPTASGKTGLAVALAHRLNGEVVSADSMQVYKGIPIGTAQPGECEKEGVPHHLIGFLPLGESYSVARWLQQARDCIADIHSRGRHSIVCGGTGLYISALLDNLTLTGEGGDPAVRARLHDRADREGTQALLNELAQTDPDTAARLHPADRKRIVRALELFETTGVTMSEQIARSKAEPSPYDAHVLLLDCRERQALYDRINRRVDHMLEQGLADEARQVWDWQKGGSLAASGATAVQAIGHKELVPWLTGELTLEQASDNLKQATRRYAKRQLSWFRRMTGAMRLYIDEYATAKELTAAAWAALNREDGTWNPLSDGC